MAKIVKTADAPEGNIEVVYAGGEFTVGGRGYKTDDATAIEVVATIPYLEVEDDSAERSASAAKEVERAGKERQEVAEAERKRAEKAPSAPAPAKSIPAQRTDTEDKD